MSNKYEIVSFNTASDIKIFVVDMTYRNFHLHKELEFIYVLEGTISVSTETEYQDVSVGECLLINSYQLHNMKSDSSTTILIIQLDLSTIEKIYPNINNIFFDFTAIPISNTKNNILYHLQLTYSEYFSKQTFTSLLCHGYLTLIIYDLLHLIPYQIINEKERLNILKENERIYRISNYIYKHYNRKLLLSEIAEIEHLSTSFMSHFFKKSFGISFQRYLRKLRCEQAYYQILNSNTPITVISNNVGFSNLIYLKKSFKEFFNIDYKDLIDTPTDIQINSNNKLNNTEKESIYSPLDSLNLLKKMI